MGLRTSLTPRASRQKAQNRPLALLGMPVCPCTCILCRIRGPNSTRAAWLPPLGVPHPYTAALSRIAAPFGRSPGRGTPHISCIYVHPASASYCWGTAQPEGTEQQQSRRRDGGVRRSRPHRDGAELCYHSEVRRVSKGSCDVAAAPHPLATREEAARPCCSCLQCSRAAAAARFASPAQTGAHRPQA